MTSIPNTLSFGGNKIWITANQQLAIIRNPAHTLIGAGYTYPNANEGFANNSIWICADGLETVNIVKDFAPPINNYLLREECSIIGEIERSTGHHFVPDSHTFTGFRLSGTVNDNQTYKATIVTSGNFHYFDNLDRRGPDHSFVTTGTGWTPGQLTAYLFRNWIYDPISQSYPRPNLSNFVDLALVTAAEFTAINGAITTYKTTPTQANYNAIETAWTTAYNAMNAAAAFRNFMQNPTLANATTLTATRFIVVARSVYASEVVQIGFSEYFQNINNTVTVTEHLPLATASASNLLKGTFGGGTPRTGRFHDAGNSDSSVEFEYGKPYSKIISNGEYGEVHVRWNGSMQSTGLKARNKLLLDLCLYVRMNTISGLADLDYHLDSSGTPVTGTINNITSFNTFLSDLTGEFPELVF